MKATFRPLRWTGPETPEEKRRSVNTFKASWDSTQDLLDRELWYLYAENLVIAADFREQDIRLAGMPRSNARLPLHPGVLVAFDSKHGPLIYRTDSCAFWQHNVRSIALGLEALRAVDRYGVTNSGEQYTGWKAVGSGIVVPPVITKEVALVELARLAGWAPISDTADKEHLGRAYRAAARRHHPDVGGARENWDQLQDVVKVLEVLR